MTKQKIEFTEEMKEVKVTFSELTVTGGTFIDLMLSIKKNEPESFESLRGEMEESIMKHLKKTNQVKQ